jgi:3-hydroxybutyryl-CoA dehydrogenase
MKKIAIIGAGAMGSGIGQVAAMAGHEVVIYDSIPTAIINSRNTILTSLQKLSIKGKLTTDEEKIIFDRIIFADQPELINGCEIVIEAIIEDETEKKKLFEQIESYVDDHAVIASNTSSLSITGLAKSLKKPERFIGIHFFNPPVLMKLVEIIPALQTSAYVTKNISELMQSWDKVPVLANDTPGFIVNRIARPFYGEALRIAEEQLASFEEIDHAMKETGGFKMGPFELMDFIGNDINDAVTRTVWQAMHYDPRYKPSSLQGNMVRAGWFGRKSGRGYYHYPTSPTSAVKSEQPATTNTQQNSKINSNEICDRIVAMLINEAADAYYYGIASRDDIDRAMTLGLNYPKGLLKWADELGINECVKRMDALNDQYREERYRCSPCLRNMAKAKMTFY